MNSISIPKNFPVSGAVIGMLAATGLLQLPAADTFGTGGDQFTMGFVTIGNPGNAPDTTGSPNPVGAVSYGYQMAMYEVSRDMINKANNAGGLGITLQDMSAYGGNGGARPATGVTWNEAALFVNWLNTSSGYTAAYNLDGGGNLSLWTPAESWTLGGENRFRNKDAHYFLPSENEWYKAAYYTGSGYYNYPTGSDVPPTAVAGGTGAGTAVYGQNDSQGPADITNAGGLSPYGTMGQGGNAFEWQESATDGLNDLSNGPDEPRVIRGGYWGNADDILASTYRASRDPALPGYWLGFRVAAIPEPMESAGAFGVLMLGFALWYQRRPR